MAHEVAVAGGVSRRDYRQAMRQSRHRKAFLKAHEPFATKTLDCLLTFKFLYADRVFRIDVVYDQRQAVELTVIYLYFELQMTAEDFATRPDSSLWDSSR